MANETRVLGCFEGWLDALAALLSLASAYIVSVLIWLVEEGLQHMLLTKLTISGLELI